MVDRARAAFISIVGRLPNDTALIGGKNFSMRQHGFARAKRFSLVEKQNFKCCFRLEADDETREQYPFDFSLDATFTIEGPVLHVAACILNQSSRAMPVSFGFHPAFRWPLPYGGDRHDHDIRFEKEEHAPIRRAVDGLLDAASSSTLFEGRIMRLGDEMFEPSALIFDRLDSRAVTFGVPGKPSIQVRFANMPHLGIWTKPGAGFLCIEPWQGYAAPSGFTGELQTKPGMISLPPGESATFAMDICLLAARQDAHDLR